MKDDINEDRFEDRLNTLLNEPHQVSPGLEQRILANLPHPATDALQPLIDWVANSFARAALTVAVPLVCGFVAGFGQDYAIGQLDDEVVTLAFAASFEELDYE